MWFEIVNVVSIDYKDNKHNITVSQCSLALISRRTLTTTSFASIIRRSGDPMRTSFDPLQPPLITVCVTQCFTLHYGKVK